MSHFAILSCQKPMRDRIDTARARGEEARIS